MLASFSGDNSASQSTCYDRNTGMWLKSNRTEQSAAHLQNQTCICAPEQDRLLSLMKSGKKKKKNWMHWCHSSCLKKPPPTTVSHRIKLPDWGRAGERRGREKEEARPCHIIVHTLNSNTRSGVLFVIIRSMLSSALKSRAWVVSSGAASDCKFSWHANPEANTTHELQSWEALVLSERPEQ